MDGVWAQYIMIKCDDDVNDCFGKVKCNAVQYNTTQYNGGKVVGVKYDCLGLVIYKKIQYRWWWSGHVYVDNIYYVEHPRDINYIILDITYYI